MSNYDPSAVPYDYSPFGQVTSSLHVGGSMADVASNPLTFSSEVHDSTLGLQYYNYRHLNLLDGRWVNRDPIGEKGGANINQFCGNRALSMIDIQGGVAFAPFLPFLWNVIKGTILDTVFDATKNIAFGLFDKYVNKYHLLKHGASYACNNFSTGDLAGADPFHPITWEGEDFENGLQQAFLNTLKNYPKTFIDSSVLNMLKLKIKAEGASFLTAQEGSPYRKYILELKKKLGRKNWDNVHGLTDHMAEMLATMIKDDVEASLAELKSFETKTEFSVKWDKECSKVCPTLRAETTISVSYLPGFSHERTETREKKLPCYTYEQLLEKGSKGRNIIDSCSLVPSKK
jgi:RHS repeat-associated protein